MTKAVLEYVAEKSRAARITVAEGGSYRRIGDPAPDGSTKVSRLTQRPLQPRRGDVHRVAAEVASQDVGDKPAEGMVNPVRVIHVDAEARRRD